MKRKGYFEIITAGVLWGTIGLFIQMMNQNGSDAALTSFIRIFFALIIMFLITSVKYGLKVFRVSGRTLFVCALLGTICHGVYNVLYTLAVTYSGVTVSAVLLNIAPVFTAMISFVAFSEHISKQKLFALFVNVAGCALAATGGKFDFKTVSFYGLLFGVGAGFCYSLTAVIGRFASEKTNSYVVSTYSYLFASAVLFFFTKPWDFQSTVNLKILLWGFLFALVPTSVAYIIYYNGVRKITETSKVPVLASAETVVSALVGIIVFHEKIGFVNVLGIILVFSSIIMISRLKPLKSRIDTEV